MTLRAIIFDFNGVLIDDEHQHFLAFQKTLSERGHTLTERDYLQRYLGLDDRACLTTALRDRGDDVTAGGAAPTDKSASDAGWALVERKAAHYEAELANGMKLMDSAAALVRDCARHLPIAIASGARRREIELVLERAGLASCFQLIVSADDVLHGKPAPDGYLAALAGLRGKHPALQARECLVLEDAPNGVHAAKAAGMHVIAVTSSVSEEVLREAEPHAILANLRDVTLSRLELLL